MWSQRRFYGFTVACTFAVLQLTSLLKHPKMCFTFMRLDLNAASQHEVSSSDQVFDRSLSQVVVQVKGQRPEVNSSLQVWRRSPAVWCWRPSAAPAASVLVGTDTRCASRPSSWCERSLWTHHGFGGWSPVCPGRLAGTVDTERGPASAAYCDVPSVDQSSSLRTETRSWQRRPSMFSCSSSDVH